MKTKLLLLFAICLTAFSMNAQINSVAIVGTAVGGWPTGAAGEIDTHQLTQVDADNWVINDLTIAVGPCKLRANNSWSGAGFEWAGAFPTAAGTSAGDILVPIAGIYTVTLNTATGVYNFSSGPPLPVVKLIGTSVADANGLTLQPVSAEEYKATNVTLLDGTGQFDIDGSVFGETTFPMGTLQGNTDNIPVVAGVYSSVTLNLTTGDYDFVLAPVYPSIAIVGSGAGGWPSDPQIDANVLTTTDGETYKGMVTLTADAGSNEIKFRSNNNWTDPNWGGLSFPTGPQAGNEGDNILVTVAGTYDVVFTRSTGAYAFSFPGIAIVGSGTAFGWPTDPQIDALQMTTTDGANYSISDVVLNSVDPDNQIKFRSNNNWDDPNYGGVDFPAGPGADLGGNIVVTTSGTYDVTFNRVTKAYLFTDALATTTFKSNNFKVYPNPTQNVWNFASAKQAIQTIQIVDVLGKTVMTISPKEMNATVDASSLVRGLYFAKISTADATETAKLMKN